MNRIWLAATLVVCGLAPGMIGGSTLAAATLLAAAVAAGVPAAVGAVPAARLSKGGSSLLLSARTGVYSP